MTLYGREGSQVASFVHKSGYNKGAKPRNVPVHTLGNIVKEHIKVNEDIHFLKIDVEGMESQCIKGMDFDYIMPWILCIESVDPRDVSSLGIEWEPILYDKGYRFAMQNRVNRYYISNNHIDLMDRFKQPEELKNIYNVTRFTESSKKYEKYENFMRRIKDLPVLRPVRFVFNYIKNSR